jgi:hypothetical protein
MSMTHRFPALFSSLNCRRLLAGIAMVGAVAAQAQWQWLDKGGRKVYSDRPPPADVMEKNILKRPGGQAAAASAVAAAQAAAAAATTAPDAAAGIPQAVAPAAPATAASGAASAVGNLPKLSSVDKELEAKKKKATDAEAAKRKLEEERVSKGKADNCALAKQAKATLDSGMRIASTNAKGEREVMDDAGRAAEVKRVQGVVKSDCS